MSYRFGTGVFIDIKHDQAQRHFQWRAVGHVTLLTFFNIVFGLFQLIFHEFQNGCFVEILDRKDRLEHAVDAFAVHWRGLIARVQEQVIRRFLNLDEVRHLKNFTNFAVIFAETLLA